ncbi:Mu transposase C-terminal domain-containing protein [Pseudoduganella umbonata]|uniref:DDE-type integrase/transposase/recombinase n=1 Tax=Pseudoduganella umbonata TaxID=864828 RepID=A0A4P8HWG4_9BURK|nr:Mu transposase C-terminal domain-containing protein [Pseudoduganella umbonata]MBB3224465.1 putative transposase [Pseudoduganella umbonata]QCP13238.1 DDE-type integrase/transposase/recombinase [Pseudoduganella umbonata]
MRSDNRIHKAFYTAEPGQLVTSGGRRYRITHLVSVDSVFAVDLETNESTRLRIDTLDFTPVLEDAAAKAEVPRKDLAQYSDEEWAEAQRRMQAIKPLLDRPMRPRSETEKIAQGVGVHVSTLYKWLKAYQLAGHVSALVPSKPGRRTGVRLLTDEQEKLIESVIADDFLTKQRNKPQHIVDEVNRRARLAKIPAPHANTVRNRLKSLPARQTLRERGRRDLARGLYEPIKGEFPGADFPLAIVQIDHTPADIIVVDEAHRRPIGRPWLTLAIDTYSRMIVGLYLTFEKPSSTSVAMCLANAICPKREYLATLGVAGEWPVWGVMNVLHLDNAKEFHGAVLERGCEEYNIDLQWRRPGVPEDGGTIERMMGTVANQVHKWPGTTFSNPQKRKGYDSEAEAALTLAEFERNLVDFIVNVYHQRRHAQLGMAPIKKWADGVAGDATRPGKGIPAVPADPMRLRLDFMPIFYRSVQQYGIQIDLINYYDKVLNPYINSTDPNDEKKRRQFLIRRDPRDISKIYFFDPLSEGYVQIPYRDIGHPPMSAWELKDIQRELREKGRRDIDENAIFEALGRMRAMVESAVHKTKSARRQATRNPAKMKHSQDGQKPIEVILETEQKHKQPVLDDDPFAQPVVPFDDISVYR